MHFNGSLKRNPTSPRESDDPVMPNFELLSYYLENTVPKNNLADFRNSNRPHRRPPKIYPDDGTFSPIPPNFRYTIKVPSHYSESGLNWGEPSFDFGMDLLDDNIFEKVSISTQNSPTQSNNPVTSNFPLPPPPKTNIPKNNVGAHQNTNAEKEKIL